MDIFFFIFSVFFGYFFLICRCIEFGKINNILRLNCKDVEFVFFIFMGREVLFVFIFMFFLRVVCGILRKNIYLG